MQRVLHGSHAGETSDTPLTRVKASINTSLEHQASNLLIFIPLQKCSVKKEGGLLGHGHWVGILWAILWRFVIKHPSVFIVKLAFPKLSCVSGPGYAWNEYFGGKVPQASSSVSFIEHFVAIVMLLLRLQTIFMFQSALMPGNEGGSRVTCDK